jgi:hypothetical protein
MRMAAALGSLAFLWVCACSPSKPSSSGSVEQVCTQYADGFCSRLASCSKLRLDTLFESAAACESRMKTVCTSLLQAEGTGFTPEKYDTCAKAYASADCDELLVFGFRPAACQVPGMLENGAGCGDGSQCKSSYCTMDFYSVCGVCADPVPAGGQCSKSGQCQAGLGCVSPGTCETLAKENESCADAACAGGLKCVDGTCRLPLTAGATCDLGRDDCDAQIGLHCDATTQRCVDFATAAMGASCGSGEICLASGNCNANQLPAVCEPAADDGQSCGSADQRPCKYPALCSDGVCTLPNSADCH